jgi:serine protease inhibitor
MIGQRVYQNSHFVFRHGSTRIVRRLVAVAVVAVVATACGASAASPSAAWTSSLGPGASPTRATPWPATQQPSPTQTPSIVHGEFDVAMGSAPLAYPADDAGAVAGMEIDDFGLDLLRQLDAGGNSCISPTSVALALAMVRPGARGQTAAEMDSVLHDLGTDANGSEIAALLKSLAYKTQYVDGNGLPLIPGATPDPANPDPVTELDVSNQAFVQNGLSLEPAYLDALSSRFGAGLGLLDFAKDPEAARLAINKWASERTNGRIPQVLHEGDVTILTRIALANAIYLKAAWETKFDPALTRQASFTTAAGTDVSVPTMAIDHTFGYTAGSGYRAVELPYSGGMSMTVVVPDDMASFVSGLTADKLRNLIVPGPQTYDVDLTLPRFSIDTRFDLGAALSAMGMPTVFSQSADLSGITTQDQLYLAKVIHEANIDVVESGTTAAAVTVALGAATGGEPAPPIHVALHVDRPFLYFIRDWASGAVLFEGRVDDPSK